MSDDRPNQGRYHDSPDESVTAHKGSNVNVNRFTERAGLAVAVVAIALAVASIVTSLWAIHEADRSEREFKQVQVQLMYSNAIMLREGLVQPGDMVYGPEGNLEYRQHELKRKEK